LKTSNFTYLLANPQKITSADLSELNALIGKYPYFQSARALQLKGLKNSESSLYNEALKLTAAHTTERDILFEYITSEKFIQNEISQTILQHDASVEEIKDISENITDQLSLEIDRQLKVERQKAEDILNPELFQRKVESVENLVDKKAKILQPDKPLEFTKNDTHSFSEWLKLTKAKPIERSEGRVDEKNEELQKDDRERKFELIERFIQERPKIIPSEIAQNNSKKEEQANIPKSSAQPSDSLMTETLAKVYLQQKNYKKAIQAYKILILKNPEKSGFFADQIRAIEKLINTEQQ